MATAHDGCVITVQITNTDKDILEVRLTHSGWLRHRGESHSAAIIWGSCRLAGGCAGCCTFPA